MQPATGRNLDIDDALKNSDQAPTTNKPIDSKGSSGPPGNGNANGISVGNSSGGGTGTGGLSDAEILAALSAQKAAFAKCGSVTMKLTLKIKSDGTIDNASASGGDMTQIACALKVVNAIKFPAASSPTSATVSYVLGK
jgi:hypothetical protein